MKITNKMVIDSVSSLNTLNELKLPVKTAFRLAKITKKLNEILEAYNSVLQKLQQEYVEKDEEGKQVTFIDPATPSITRLSFKDREAFDAAYQELLGIETEIEITKISLDDLGNVEIKSSTLYDIDWLIEG